jgi:hypothetical protein
MREEDKINTKEKREEEDITKEIIKMKTGDDRASIKESGKDSKDSTKRKDVMKMANNKISIMKSNIKGRTSE